MSDYQATSESSGRMSGSLILAAALTILVGALHIVIGLAAVGNKDFFQSPGGYWYHWDADFWGWIQIIGGAIVVVAGLALFFRRDWAAYTVVSLAGLSAIFNFFLIPFYPVGIILLIALDVLVIWAVTRPGTGLDEWV
jgi:hypothetical protein